MQDSRWRYDVIEDGGRYTIGHYDENRDAYIINDGIYARYWWDTEAGARAACDAYNAYTKPEWLANGTPIYAHEIKNRDPDLVALYRLFGAVTRLSDYSITPAGRLDLLRHDTTTDTGELMRPYLDIDPETGRLDWGHEYQTDGTPEEVYHHRILRYYLDPCTIGDDFTDRINAGEIDGMLDEIRAGHIITWDGQNMVGKMDIYARDVETDLQRWLHDLETHDGGILHAGGWLPNGAQDVPALSATTTDAELSDLVAEIESDAASEDYILYGTYEHLVSLREGLREKE